MASLRGDCSVACKTDKRSCWHSECKILRRFQSGKFLIENRHGFVRAAVPFEMHFSTAETSKYIDYEVILDDIELGAKLERELLKARYKRY